MFDILYILKAIPMMLDSFAYTVLVVIESLLLCFILAIPITAVRIKKVPVLSQLCGLWLSFIRSMPGMLELFIAYFVLPGLLKGIHIDTSGWPATVYVLIAMMFHYIPYLSEILRPAYLSVDKGQHEAAAAIGMTGLQTFRRIIAAQTLPVALPQLCNTAIDIVKDTSLLFTIGVIDLMGKAKLIITDTYGIRKMETYIAVAIFYWILTAVVSNLFKLGENYFKKYKLSTGIKLQGGGK